MRRKADLTNRGTVYWQSQDILHTIIHCVNASIMQQNLFLMDSVMKFAYSSKFSIMPLAQKSRHLIEPLLLILFHTSEMSRFVNISNNAVWRLCIMHMSLYFSAHLLTFLRFHYIIVDIIGQSFYPLYHFGFPAPLHPTRRTACYPAVCSRFPA